MKKILKWSLIIGGGFLGLLFIIGLITRATMSPEERAAMDSVTAAKAEAKQVAEVAKAETDAKAETVAESATPVSSGGLGKDREFFKDKYGKVFNWSESPLNDGRDRLFGQSDNGLGTIELIGPEDNLTAVTMMVGVTAQNQTDMGTVLGDFALNVEPESVNWIAEHVEDGGTTTINGTEVSVNRLKLDGGSMIVLSFKKQ